MMKHDFKWLPTCIICNVVLLAMVFLAGCKNGEEQREWFNCMSGEPFQVKNAPGTLYKNQTNGKWQIDFDDCYAVYRLESFGWEGEYSTNTIINMKPEYEKLAGRVKASGILTYIDNTFPGHRVSSNFDFEVTDMKRIGKRARTRASDADSLRVCVKPDTLRQVPSNGLQNHRMQVLSEH